MEEARQAVNTITTSGITIPEQAGTSQRIRLGLLKVKILIFTGMLKIILLMQLIPLD